MKWFNKILNLFSPQETKKTLVQEEWIQEALDGTLTVRELENQALVNFGGMVQVQDVPKKEPELTEFQKIQSKFNKNSDILVISEDTFFALNTEDAVWVESLGDHVIYFTGNSLVNIAIIKSYGSHW